MRSQLTKRLPSSASPSISSRVRPKRVAQNNDLAPDIATSEEEVLVVDGRAEIRPAQLVEDKLSRILQRVPVGVSQLRLRNLIARRITS
jgi:hypothetical protein